MSVARELATRLTAIKPAELPVEPKKHAAMLVASTLASAALGSNISSASIIRSLAEERGGAPQASVWFSTCPKLPIGDAARVNALMSDAAASDDSDLRNIMHCGTPLAAASLAVAECEGASGAEVMSAIVLGYEAAGRMNDAIPKYRTKGFHGSTITIFSAVVAAGRLLRLDENQLTHAIALAATSTGGLSKAADTSLAREYNAGQAVMNGIQAALAARRGYTAEERILEMPGGFFATYGGADCATAREAMFADFSASWDIVTDMAVKLVPGGHPYHAFGEAAGNAVREAGIRPEEIERIIVSRPGLTTLPPPLHPENLIDMAHSPAYFAAAGARDGTFSWVHASPEKISDPTIHHLIDRIEVGVEPTEQASRFRRGATVTVVAKDGRSSTNTVFIPKGGAMLGLDWADIDAKYRSLMPYSALPEDRIERSLELIHGLEGLRNISPLMELLRG